MSLARALLVGTGVGVAGWLLENLLIKRYDSPAFRGVPFLPIYASGGLAVALLAPRLEGLSTLERFTAYGVALSALEEAAGRADEALGRRSWDYGGGARSDVPHAVAWGVLGLLVESLAKGAKG